MPIEPWSQAEARVEARPEKRTVEQQLIAKQRLVYVRDLFPHEENEFLTAH